MRCIVLAIVAATTFAVSAPAAGAHTISRPMAEAMSEEVVEVFLGNLEGHAGVASIDGYASGACRRTVRQRRHIHGWRCYYRIILTRAGDGLQIDCFGAIDVRFRPGTRRMVGIRRQMECEAAE